MYDIYAYDMTYEQCTADKEKINTVVPYAVFHFVLSGEGYINNKQVGADTVFIAYENSKMNYYPSTSDPWSYIYVRLRGDGVQKAFSDLGFDRGITVLPFHKREELFHILSLGKSLSDNEARKAIANLVFLLFDKPKQSKNEKSKPLQHAEEIKQYIDNNYHKKLSVAGISDSFYLNKNYVRTLFCDCLGMSPKQYIQNVRMERARFLLSDTSESISLISRAVGYDDPLLFSKMFKQYNGVSPLQYRADSKKAGSEAVNIDFIYKE